jgi:predicted transcriptional regulator
MSKILVDKDELKGLRDNIDYLLETGKQSFAIFTQQPIYESYDLEKREQLIIEYLNKNPGSTKEQVVNGLEKNYSRMPVLNTINKLLEKGLIIKEKDKNRKRTYHLFVNYQNIVTSLREELAAFKHFYFELLDQAIPVINNLLKDEGEEVKSLQYWNLLNALIYPYKYLCIMYITSDIFLWHRRPLDNDTLHRKFEIFFKTTKQIHSKLLEIWPDSESESIVVSPILFSSSFGFSKSYIEEMLERFEEYGLSDSVEPVLDVLWKISYPILPLVDPSSYNEYSKNGTLKDWRAVLKDDPESKYRAKTEKLPFDE